jgi:hypothetical protein
MAHLDGVMLLGILVLLHLGDVAFVDDELSVFLTTLICEFYLMPWGVTCLAYRG